MKTIKDLKEACERASQRFNIDAQLKQVLENTCNYLRW